MQRLSVVLLASILSLSSAAADKKAELQARVEDALRASDIEADGAAPFELEAHTRLLFDRVYDGTFKLFWVSHNQWREETSFGDYREVVVRNDNKKWVSRSTEDPPYRVQQLTGLLVPSAYHGEQSTYAVRDVKKRVLAGVHVECAKLTRKNATFSFESNREMCFEPASKIIKTMMITVGDSSQELLDYAPIGDKQYPRTQRMFQGGIAVVEVFVDKLIQQRPGDDLLQPLPGAIPWDACDDIKPPKPLHTPDPTYPEDARSKHVEGTAALYVVVDPNGRVERASIIRSLGPSLDKAAHDAVKTWRFKPATCGTTPVRADINVEVSFRLR